MISQVRPLTQLERTHAKQAAAEAVTASYGSAPNLEAFTSIQRRMTPADVFIWMLSTFILFAAFSLSAMRLFSIGRDTFAESIDHAPSAVVAGAAIVILAEITQLVSGIALVRVDKRELKLILWLIGLGATVLAIVGNFEVVRPFERSHPLFALIEALFPPLVVLAIAHVLKTQLLMSLFARQRAQQEYEAAFQKWQAAIAAPAESHPEWPQFYANALRDRLRAANSRSKSGRAALADLTTADWRALVYRELQTDRWYEGIEPVTVQVEQEAVPSLPEPHGEPQKIMQYVQSPSSVEGRRRPRSDETRALVAAALSASDGRVATCPTCGKRFEKETPSKLKHALTAHISRFCSQRKP